METPANTKSTALSTTIAARQKVKQLLSLQKISREDVENLNQTERQYLGRVATKKLGRLTGAGRSDFLLKIEHITDENTNNQIWEENQMVISNAITRFIAENGFMPPKTLIAEQTGLSRPTVAKHFKQYTTHPEYQATIQQFKFMAPQVLAAVFKSSQNGDTRAARLYFEMVGAISKQQPGMLVTKQNNYIQINNTILSQENLSRLTAEQLNQIETIIRNVNGK